MEINSNEESELIDKNSDKLRTHGYHFWLGLTKRDSTWNWENDGDAEFTRWSSGEPNDSCNYPPCNCAYIYCYTMEWFDESCDTCLRHVFCESNPLNLS